MRAANDYLILKETTKTTDKALREMRVATNDDIEYQIISVGDNADTSQFTVGAKIIVDINPSYYFYTDGERFIAVRAGDVKAIL